MLTRIEYHQEIARLMQKAEDEGCLAQWMREMCLNDIFFLGVYVLGRTDLDHIKRPDGTVKYRDWLYERCQEVQAAPDGFIDIWSRDHYKSTIFTFLKTIQDVLRDPEITCCIYSYSSSAATNFLKQIKGVLESNKKLIKLFPGILFEDVTKPHWIDEKGQQRRMIWSERGIRVKRKSNAKENTVEASGLVIGQRTGGHFNLLIYDDVVTPDSVTSPEMIKKTTEQWRMSLNTGSSGNLRIRILGTRYHYADTYQTIIDSGYATLRLYPCVYKNGAPVLYDRDVIEAKKKAMGSAVFASQMMCDPKQASTMGFKREWIRTWSADNITNLNIYIIVDPAGTMKKRSDYSAFWVIGCGADKNYYIIDLIRDKFDLTGKTNTLFELMRRYTTGSRKPQVFYEKAAMQSDIEHIEYVMDKINYRFSITPAIASAPKGQRIEALEPLFREARIWMPSACWHVNWEGMREDMLSTFKFDEYLAYPFAGHDDALDALSRIADAETGANMAFPDAASIEDKQRSMLISRGMKLKDVITLDYEPM